MGKLLNAVFLVHAVPGMLAGAVVVMTRGRFLVPHIPKSATVATDAFGCSVATIGLIGALLWRERNTQSKRLVAGAFAAYHGMVVLGASLRVWAGRPGACKRPNQQAEVPDVSMLPEDEHAAAANLQQGAGSAVVHGAVMLWFLAFLKHQPREDA